MVNNEKDELFSLLAEFDSVFVEISDDWVTSCCNSLRNMPLSNFSQENNYTDYEEFASEVQLSILNVPNFSEQLSELCAATLRYEQKARDGEEIWIELSNKKMKAEKFVLFLWTLLERALSGKVVVEERISGLLAASLYIAMCSLNGSQAFNIFNQFLFQKSLEVLRVAYKLLALHGYHGKDSIKKSKARSLKGRKRTKSTFHEATAESSVVEALTATEEAEFKELLFTGLDSLFVFLNKVPLFACQETSIVTAYFIKDVMQIDLSENTEVIECRRYSDFQQRRRFSDRCFALMHRLMAPRHFGAELVLSRIVMPRLLFWTFENTVLPPQAHPTKVMESSKNLMLHFLESRREKRVDEELEALFRLLGNICYRCPDRSDYRAKVSDCVCKVLELLPDCYHYKFSYFLLVFGSNTRISFRNFAVEVAPLLLKLLGVSNLGFSVRIDARKMQNKKQKTMKKIVCNVDHQDVSEISKVNDEESQIMRPVDCDVAETISFKPVDELILYIVRACNDKASTVRTRAIFQISEFLEDCHLRSVLPNYFAKAAGEESFDGCLNESLEGDDCNNLMLKMLLIRARDSKASTRKSAVYTLKILFPYLDGESDSMAALKCLQERCRDESLLIRKQAAESISKIVLCPFARDTDIVDQVWLNSVLPLVTDREQSVVKRASELVVETLISPLFSEDSMITWRILAAVEREVNHRRLFSRALIYQVKENLLSEDVVTRLLRISKQPELANIVWMLLNDFSIVFKVDPTPAYQFWFTLVDDDSTNITFYVAYVLARSADRLNESGRKRLIEDIGEKISNFRLPEKHIPSVYYAFAKLHHGIGETASGVKVFSEISQSLGVRCYQMMLDILYLPQGGSQQSQPMSTQNQEEYAHQLLRVICTMGEIVQYVPSLKTDKWFSELQLIMASDVIQHQLTQEALLFLQRGICNFASNSEPATNEICKSNLESLTVHKTIVNIGVITSAVRAQAVIAIGKMCMLLLQTAVCDNLCQKFQSLRLAKLCIPIFAKQVHTNNDHLVRNNIVIVVCDLCIRYTFLVDRYSEILASCLNDRSTLVRKQTLVLLTNLIKEAFIRWEGQIMYRFVSTLLDEVDEIRNYSEMCLVDVLLLQFPNMLSNHFIECLFYFNGVAHRSWTATNNSVLKKETDHNNFLGGSNNKEKRMKLYKFMAKTFDDQAKLEIMRRISNEVFFATAEGVLNISEKRVCALLEDCYNILCLKELKLSVNVGLRGGDREDEDNDYPAEVVAEVKKVFIKVYRTTIIDGVLPGIISLKYFLQDHMLGDLARGVFRVLRELSRDHREQLDEFLAGDQRLKAEIEYDLRRLEEIEGKEKQRLLVEEQERVAKRKSLRQSMVLTGQGSKFSKSNRTFLEQVSVTANKTNNAFKNGCGDEATSKKLKKRSVAIDSERTLVEKEADENEILDAGEVFQSRKNNEGISRVAQNVLLERNEAVSFANSESVFGDHKLRNANSRKRSGQLTAESKEKRSSSSVSFTRSKQLKIRSPSPSAIEQSQALDVRAVSTPLHGISEVTFALGELSAIMAPAKLKRSKRMCNQDGLS